MPFSTATRKSPGELLRSSDWNDIVDEAARLGRDKLNTTGGAVSGNLSVSGQLSVGTSQLSGTLNVASGAAVQLRVQQTNNADFARILANANGNEWQLTVGAPGSSAPNRFGVFSATANRALLSVNPAGAGTVEVSGQLAVSAAIFADGSDVYFRQTNHNHTGVGNALGFAAIENAENFGGLMILGRTVSTSPLRRVVKLWDFLEVNGDLRVTGGISSPQFRVTQVLEVQGGGLPVQGTVTSSGGLLVIFVSGSAFSSSTSGLGVRVLFDGVSQGDIRWFSNELNSHKSFPSQMYVVNNPAAGSHTVRLEARPGTNSDFNDFYSITVMELPFTQGLIINPGPIFDPGGPVIGPVIGPFQPVNP